MLMEFSQCRTWSIASWSFDLFSWCAGPIRSPWVIHNGCKTDTRIACCILEWIWIFCSLFGRTLLQFSIRKLGILIKILVIFQSVQVHGGRTDLCNINLDRFIPCEVLDFDCDVGEDSRLLGFLVDWWIVIDVFGKHAVPSSWSVTIHKSIRLNAQEDLKLRYHSISFTVHH